MMNYAKIAELCHEVNRIYCRSIGDNSQVPWKEAPDWQKKSSCNGVLFHLTNPNAGPSGSHANWLKEKLEQSWTYGPVKDPVAKTHPCCVPYEELPEDQRLKDEFFVAVVKGCKQ